MKEFPAMGCGGFNPYNSLETNAKWFFALCARNSAQLDLDDPDYEAPSASRRPLVEIEDFAARKSESRGFYRCCEGYAHPVGQPCTGQCVLRG